MGDKYRCKSCGAVLEEGVDDLALHVLGCAVHIHDHLEEIGPEDTGEER